MSSISGAPRQIQRQRNEATPFTTAVSSGHAGLPAQESEAVLGRRVLQKLDLVKCKKLRPPLCFPQHCPFSHRIRGEHRIKDRPNHGCSSAVGQDTATRVVLHFLRKEHHRRDPHGPIPREFPYTVDEYGQDWGRYWGNTCTV